MEDTGSAFWCVSHGGAMLWTTIAADRAPSPTRHPPSR